MDALALLCTLHADGPATLKRLRAMGCGSLALLLERDVDALAGGLGVPAAAARRLLREARLLRERVGVDTLEAEEAPPAALGAGSPADGAGARRPSIPDEVPDAAQPALGRSELDSGDRDLVARIVGSRAEGEPEPAEPRSVASDAPPSAPEGAGAPADGQPAPEAATASGEGGGAPDAADLAPGTAPREDAATTPRLASEPVAAPGTSATPETRDTSGIAATDRPTAPPRPVAASGAGDRSSFGAGVLDADEGRAVEEAREPDAQAEGPVESPPSPAAEVREPVAAEPEPEPAPACELRLGSLPGLDEALLEDLLAAGLDTYARIAAAETLALTRSLGVSFAQARRMRFLARREAEALAAAPEPEREPEELSEAVPAGAPIEADAAPPAPEPAEAPAVATAPTGFDGTESDHTALQRTEPQRTESERTESERTESERTASAASGPASPEARSAGAEDEDASGASAAAEEPPARKAFWESRILRETEAAEAGDSEGQRVDPSEIEAPPRFGDRFARAAAEGRLRRSRTSPGRTVLGWNFEVPRPEPEDLPLASLGRPAPHVAEGSERDGAPAAGDDVAAGPFA